MFAEQKTQLIGAIREVGYTFWPPAGFEPAGGVAP